jgi:putative ABC transport system ATP-binding protein
VEAEASERILKILDADESDIYMAEDILTMNSICKDYDMGGSVLHVLKNVDLTVQKGEFLAILGPSGSGKSTLMNIMGCLDVPTSGEYRLHSKLIANENETSLAHIRSAEIGFIFQAFHLMQKQTALQNVALPLIYANVSKTKRMERAAEMLEMVGLSDKMDNLPSQLSGGQQQRVAIARAVINNPSIILADEPTGALDQKTGSQVMDLFQTLNKNGNTIVMITHDTKIAKHAGRIVRILDGILTEGELADA